MDQHAREAYIEAQVMTATPQKLRLMLIEGAVRCARQAIQHWQAGDNERGSNRDTALFPGSHRLNRPVLTRMPYVVVWGAVSHGGTYPILCCSELSCDRGG